MHSKEMDPLRMEQAQHPAPSLMAQPPQLQSPKERINQSEDSQCDTEKAVSKHFEESLRRANVSYIYIFGAVLSECLVSMCSCLPALGLVLEYDFAAAVAPETGTTSASA